MNILFKGKPQNFLKRVYTPIPAIKHLSNLKLQRVFSTNYEKPISDQIPSFDFSAVASYTKSELQPMIVSVGGCIFSSSKKNS